MPTQLQGLVRRFPAKYVHTNPSGGGSYVGHEVITQRLLHVLGPFSTSVEQVVRGIVPGIEADPKGSSKRAREGRPVLMDAVVGVLLALTVDVDGRTVTVTEVGDCEDPHNWPHDGARMKDAMSDAIKRCAMRLGVAIHLWAQDEFYIDAALAKAEEARPADGNGGQVPAPSPSADDREVANA